MIKLIDNGPDSSVIEFRSRPLVSVPTITRELIYGHECPWCGNTVQALYLTKESVKLSLYEETRVINQGDKNEGLLAKVIPNSNEPDSAYRTIFYQTPKGNAELIRLKNHIALWRGVGASTQEDRDKLFESGERCCKFIGVFSRREEDTVDETLLMLGSTRYSRAGKLRMPLSFLVEAQVPTWSGLEYRIVPAIGRSHSMLMVPREYAKNGQESKLGPFISAWTNKLEQDKQALLQEQI